MSDPGSELNRVFTGRVPSRLYRILRIPKSEVAATPLTLHRIALKDVDVATYSRELKGILGESRTAVVLRRAGYEELPARLRGNQGFDGVWLKRNAQGRIVDIVITESKFASDGVFRLTLTKTMGRQLSNEWIDANIQRLLNSLDPELVRVGQLLDLNRHLIRPKGALLVPSGVLRFCEP